MIIFARDARGVEHCRVQARHDEAGKHPRGKKTADFFLYVDEAHILPSDNFMELLSEARKYRMSLVLSTQYCGPLTRRSTSGVAGNDLLSAISGNVGTTIIFRLGSEDAREMARMLYPHFTALDIIGLPNFHGYTYGHC